MAEQFEKGDTVELKQPGLKVNASNTHHTECILEDGTKIIISTKLLKLISKDK